ncbi:MAG: type IX secretion system sortase PorU [Muribaculaceae bacterium]|nr:type IX secretion system sortase PorU [Muribaculaceae bacterium]
MNRTSKILLSIIIPAYLAQPAQALNPEHYAEHSALAEGKWVRVQVSEPGMQLMSDTELRRLGFPDPTKVKAYGLGGRQLNNGLSYNNPDDLPMLPSVRTSKGLVFYATDNVTWEGTSSYSSKPYTHTMHEYSLVSYYYLSDSERGSLPPTVGTTMPGVSSRTPRTTFAERLLHEQEIEPAGNSGSQVYGEDFRSRTSQTFDFSLPGHADDRLTVNVRFAAKTANSPSLLKISAANQWVGTSSGHSIPTSANDVYCNVIEPCDVVTGIDDRVSLKLDYSYSGTLSKARLDYIELFYNRNLHLDGSELHFYDNFNSGDAIELSGCTQQTMIWDVTNPAAPVEVNFTLSGDKALFTIATQGMREFVAFNPEQISRNPVSPTAVANQDIHGLPVPDMVIITHPEYQEGAEAIAQIHRETDGMLVHVIDTEDIYREFSGGHVDVGAWRRMLKMWHDRGLAADGEHKLQYCLIMGKPLFDNKKLLASTRSAGFNPMPIYESFDGLQENYSYCNDDWIGMLDDVEHSIFARHLAKIHVAVGRLPVTSRAEALNMAAKIKKYTEEPVYGSWRNKIMVIADDDDNNSHFNQAQTTCRNIQKEPAGAALLIDKLYLDIYPRVMTGLGPTYPQATERMMRNYNDGVMFTNYIGHASATGWGHEHLWDWSSITTMTNKNLTFIHASTCGFAYWDEPSVSGAEQLVLNPEAGAIGMIAATRTVYISANGELNASMGKELMKRDADGRPRRYGDLFREMKNNRTSRNTNDLRYVLIGDPAVRMPGGSHSVSVENIAGTDVTVRNPKYPECAAKSTIEVSGSIKNHLGETDSEFNGTINLQLYDSERVITTLGQGKSGIITSYNDRDKRLSATNAEVKNGIWCTILRIPPEIQGNYSPAMISAYAWSNEGNKEATGYSSSLYVYGYNDSEDSDNSGPVIEEFYVNRRQFKSGDVVSPNPVIFATLRDASGINISQSGIGHSMTLAIDDNDYRSDLNSYFETDSSDPNFGRLVYPLEKLGSGRHTLTLTVWDNANNASQQSLEINVGSATEPTIHDITASVNTAAESIDFIIQLDRPNTQMEISTGIYDLSGRKVWESEKTVTTDMESTTATRWDYTDRSGNRVARGIYIFRVYAETPEGTYASKSKKIAVSAK